MINNRDLHMEILVDGFVSSINTVIPFQVQTKQSQLSHQDLRIQFGVLVGITGDVRGKIVLNADTSIFNSIGEAMFGMPITGEMLPSFSGELGNMIVGGLATNIATQGLKTDITSPTVMAGDTNLLGFGNATMIDVTFQDIGKMFVYLLIDR